MHNIVSILKTCKHSNDFTCSCWISIATTSNSASLASLAIVGIVIVGIVVVGIVVMIVIG